MNTSLMGFFFFFIVTQGITFRLPTTVEPLFYSIKIQPNLNDNAFYGEVTIKVKIRESVDSIILHSSNLIIKTVLLDTDNKIFYSLDPDLEFIKISHSNHSEIISGIHSIHIKYIGTIGAVEANDEEANEIEEGVIRLTSDKLDDYYVITNIWPTKARRVFPCFDEPAFMAQFQLTLIVPENNYSAISNTQLLTSTRTSNGVVHKFDITPKMPANQLSFVISDFGSSETKISYGNTTIDIRLNFRNGNFDVMESVSYMAKTIEFLANYTNFSYPLSKIDFVEAPEDIFEFGWGFVTFSLKDVSSLTSAENLFDFDLKKAFAWFNNIVTNQWWDDIWMQPSLAAVVALKLQSTSQDELLFSDVISYMTYEYDFYVPTEPVVGFIEQPEDFCKFERFHSFFKGVAILQMAEMVIGETEFQMAVQSYINNFAYKTSTSKNLISSFENFTNYKEIGSFFKSYLHQSKFPILRVQENENEYILTQEHYDSYLNPTEFLDIEDESEINCTYRILPVPGEKWTIPITYISDLNTIPTLMWFPIDMDNLLVAKNGEEWIKFNYRNMGYYRIIYSKNMWDQILRNSEEIGENEVFHLAFEAVQLFIAELVPCEYAIKLIENLSTSDKDDYWLLIEVLEEEFLKFLDYDTMETFNAFIRVISKESSEETFSSVNEHISKLWDFLERFDNSIPNVTGMRRRRREIRRTNLDSLSQEESEDIIVPQHIQQCSKWIKENLSKYQTLN